MIGFRVTLSSGFCVSTEWEVVFFRGTMLAEVILVKGHELQPIVKVLPVGFYLSPTSVNTWPVGAKGSKSSLNIPGTIVLADAPVENLEREIKRLKRSRIPLVKVHWNLRRGPEFTWEREDSFKKKYPHLFTNRAPSSTTMS
ncbi:hypothetical protein Tco_1176667 [Tanacetum coccineum]